MAQTLTKIFQVTLGAADTLIYTCPALTTAVLTALYKVNADTVNRTFRLHAVDSGSSIALGNALYYDEPITAKRVHPRIDTSIILTSGAMLRGLASVGAVIVCTGYGILIEEEA